MNPHTQEHHDTIKRRDAEAARFAKLPAFARNEIARLRADLEDARGKLHAMTVPGDSNVELVDGIEARALPPGSHVRFHVDGGHVDVYPVSPGWSQHVDGSLVVHSIHRLRILPASSNLVHVEVEHPVTRHNKRAPGKR